MWPFGVGTPTVYVSGATSSPSLSQQIPPGNVLETVIFNVPALATETGNPEVIVAACGGQYWGGCEVWLSYDNTTYSQIGVIQGQCRCGTLTGTLASTSTGYPAQDTASSLQIVQGCSYQRNLSTISAGVAADLNGLFWVGSSGVDSEMVAYQTATLTGPGAYTCTNLYRGVYGTNISAHPSGDQWCYLDGMPLQFVVPPSRNGQTLYFKFLSFNLYGQALQALSDVSAVPYTPSIPSYPPPINVTIVSNTPG